MTCTQALKQKTSIAKPTDAPTKLVGSQASIGTRFICSDNPETINSTTTTFTNGYATL